MRNKITLSLGFGISVLACTFALAQDLNDQVYRVSARHCGPDGDTFIVTGFRTEVNGIVGLVTALHGVVGCNVNSINASNNSVYADDLKLARVNIFRDLAFFRSKKLASNTSGPLRSSGDFSGQLKVVGYPQGVLEQNSHNVSIQERAFTPLKSLIPPGTLRNKLGKRRSPHLEAEILNIAGALQNGYSGAPILNPGGTVVAVGNGGLLGGFADINWAIPFEGISWDRVGDVLAQLEDLSTKTATAVFGATNSETNPNPTLPGTPVGKRVIGQVFYDGGPVKRFTKALAKITLHKKDRTPVSVVSKYDNQTGRFQLDNVPPGRYRLAIRLEAGWPYDAYSPGDFSSNWSGYNDDLFVAPHSEKIEYDFRVHYEIHLVKPLDNYAVDRVSYGDPPETLCEGSGYSPPAGTFEWEPVPGASHYQVRFLLMDELSGDRLNHDMFQTKATRITPNLTVNKPDTKYMFSVVARNSKGENIGDMTFWTSGSHGGWFEFKVFPHPDCWN